MIPAVLVTKYLDRKPEELKTCKELLAEENFPELKNVGHKLKGNGTTFGFPEVSSIGKKLEHAAGQNDRTEVQSVLKEFETWVNTTSKSH